MLRQDMCWGKICVKAKPMEDTYLESLRSLFSVQYFARMFVFAPYICLVPVEATVGSWVPLNGVTDGCEPPRGYWDPTLSLQEHCFFGRPEPLDGKRRGL